MNLEFFIGDVEKILDPLYIGELKFESTATIRLTRRYYPQMIYRGQPFSMIFIHIVQPAKVRRHLDSVWVRRWLGFT